MANKYAMPPNHPLYLVSYGLIAAGVLLFLSNFFFGPPDMPERSIAQRNAEFNAEMVAVAARALGGMGLIFLGAVSFSVVKWAWNNAQPETSVRVRVVSKWTTTWGAPNTGSWTHYHARFESDDSNVLDLEMGLHVYQQFGEGDNGTLVYQGSRVCAFHRA